MIIDNRPTDYILPTVYEKTFGGERGFDIYSRLLKDRIVFLGDEVDAVSANLIVAQLLFLDSQNHDDISFYINSPGGEVYSGLAIVDTMNLIKSDVATYGIGLQASMGAVLLASGTPGKRYMLPHAKTMIHQPSSGTRGRVTDMEIDLREGLSVKQILIDLLAKATGQPAIKIKQDMERDYWMTPTEARSYGLIDRVIGQSKTTSSKKAKKSDSTKASKATKTIKVAK